jgi:hypothetical protein
MIRCAARGGIGFVRVGYETRSGAAAAAVVPTSIRLQCSTLEEILSAKAAVAVQVDCAYATLNTRDHSGG